MKHTDMKKLTKIRDDISFLHKTQNKVSGIVETKIIREIWIKMDFIENETRRMGLEYK